MSDFYKLIKLIPREISILLSHYHASKKYFNDASRNENGKFLNGLSGVAHAKMFLLLAANFLNQNKNHSYFEKTVSLELLLKKLRKGENVNKNINPKQLELEISKIIKDNESLIEGLSDDRRKKIAHWDIESGESIVSDFNDLDKIAILIAKISCILQFPNEPQKREQQEKHLLSPEIIE